MIPESIFGWNPTLDGGFEVVCSRNYGPLARTKLGESKRGWHLVWLQPNEAFKAALRQHTESHLFRLVTDLLQIRGGERKPECSPPPTHLVTRFKIDRNKSAAPPIFHRRMPQGESSDPLIDWEDQQ